MLKSTFPLFFFGLISVLPSVAGASERVESHLIAAEESFLDVEYEAALAALDEAESTGEASREQIERILALRGTIHYLLDDTNRARAVFEQLLDRNLFFQLPDSHPPRAGEFLDMLRDERGVTATIEPEPPAIVEAGRSFDITARVKGLRAGQAVRLYVRGPGAQSFGTIEMSRSEGDRFVGTVGPVEPSGDEDAVDYFILVVEDNERVANAGTPRNPMTVAIGERRDRERRPAVRRWWFWTLMGGLVAAGLGFGLGFGLSATGDEPTGDLDITVRLENVE